MCFNGAGDLHCRQYQAAGCVDDKIDWSIVRRLLNRSNDRLGILQVDVSRDCKAEKAALLLTMNHRDNSGAVLFFDSRIVCARRSAYHRPISKGCTAMSATKIKNIDERSNDIGWLQFRTYPISVGLSNIARSRQQPMLVQRIPQR